MSVLEIFAVVIIGYLVGSVSFACIIARRYGVDIMKAGSGNPGSTNVKRVIGETAGNLCFLLDFLKGVFVAGLPLLPFMNDKEPELLGLLGLAAAIVGHSYSVFLNFKGGKGVAVAMGGLSVLMFWVLLIGVLVWNIVFFRTRYVSLASIAFGLSLPITASVTAIFSNGSRFEFLFALVLAIVIIIRHRTNVTRLMQGRENRFVKKAKR